MKPTTLAALFALLAVLSTNALAQAPATPPPLYFDTNGSTPGTNTSTAAPVNLSSNNWTTDSTGSSTTVGYTEGSDIVFSAGSNGTGLQQVTVNGTEFADSITVNNGAVTVLGANGPSFSLGAGGLLLNSPNGGLTFDSSLGTLNVAASQSWDVNTAGGLTVSSGLAGTGTVTLAGTGTGATLLGGPASGALGIVNNSATSSLEIAGDNGDNFSGGLTATAGTTILDHHDTLASGVGITLSNGAQLVLANTDGYAGYANTVNLGTGGGIVAAGAVAPGADIVYSGTFTGGGGLTVNRGDFLYTGGSSNVGTLNVTNGARFLAISTGILANNPVVNLNGGIFDTDFNADISDVFNLTNGSIEMRDRYYVTYHNVTFNGMNNTVGSDDVGGGTIEFTSPLSITGNVGIALNGNSNSDFFGNTEIHFDSGFTGNGNLTLSNGPSGYSRNYFFGAGDMAGTVTLNNALVNLFNNSGNVFGTSTITMNNSTIAAGGGYANYLNDNHIILGTGTNTIDTGGGIGSISAYFTSGAGSELHIIGANSTLVANANASSIGTLDADSGRLFFFSQNQQYGLNLIANNTVINVNQNGGVPYGNGALDFATGTTVSIGNQINFYSGSGLFMRGSGTNVTLTNANLPTMGTFSAGSDDTPLSAQIHLKKGLALTGNLTFGVNNSNGSNVRVYMDGAVSGTGGITVTASGDGPGTLYLTGENTYSGATTVNSATAVIDGDSSGTGTNYVVNGGTLVIGGMAGIAPADVNLTMNAASSAAPAVLQIGDTDGSNGISVASFNSIGTTSSDIIVGGFNSANILEVDNATDTTFNGVIGGSSGFQNRVNLDKINVGTLTLNGANTYTDGTTIEKGRVVVNGSVAGNVAIAAGASIGGHGTVGGTLAGFADPVTNIVHAGAVGPGNSPGILTAGAVDPTGGMTFNYEFTLTGMPNYGSAAASGNDVLHLDAGTPFLAALNSSNAINLYFSGAGTYDGGFFVNGSNSLTAALAGATFNYYVESANGTVTYNGVTYAVTTGTESVIAASNAAFADGTVNGFTEQFSVVGATPEPSTYALLGIGGLALVWMVRRKSRFNA